MCVYKGKKYCLFIKYSKFIKLIPCNIHFVCDCVWVTWSVIATPIPATNTPVACLDSAPKKYSDNLLNSLRLYQRGIFTVLGMLLFDTSCLATKFPTMHCQAETLMECARKIQVVSHYFAINSYQLMLIEAFILFLQIYFWIYFGYNHPNLIISLQ